MIVAISTIGFAIFAYLNLSQKQADIAYKRYYTEKLTEKEKILSDLDAKYNEIEAFLPLIDNALPNDKDTSNLLADFNSLATASKLKLTYMEPDSSSSSGSTKDGKAKTTGDMSLLQTVKGTNGYELPLEIRVQGSYKNFLDFIRRIENYQRLINIQSISIEKQEEDKADFIVAKLKIKAYLKR